MIGQSNEQTLLEIVLQIDGNCGKFVNTVRVTWNQNLEQWQGVVSPIMRLPLSVLLLLILFIMEEIIASNYRPMWLPN